MWKIIEQYTYEYSWARQLHHCTSRRPTMTRLFEYCNLPPQIVQKDCQKRDLRGMCT